MFELNIQVIKEFLCGSWWFPCFSFNCSADMHNPVCFNEFTKLWLGNTAALVWTCAKCLVSSHNLTLRIYLCATESFLPCGWLCFCSDPSSSESGSKFLGLVLPVLIESILFCFGHVFVVVLTTSTSNLGSNLINEDFDFLSAFNCFKLSSSLAVGVSGFGPFEEICLEVLFASSITVSSIIASCFFELSEIFLIGIFLCCPCFIDGFLLSFGSSRIL